MAQCHHSIGDWIKLVTKMKHEPLGIGTGNPGVFCQGTLNTKPPFCPHCCAPPSTSRLTVVTLSLYCPHLNPVRLLSTRHHFIVLPSYCHFPFLSFVFPLHHFHLYLSVILLTPLCPPKYIPPHCCHPVTLLSAS